MIISLRHLASILPSLCAFAIISAGSTQPTHAENWPGWRGPNGDGRSSETEIPTEWNGVTGENIAWKTPLPGWGHASPIVWGDRIFTVACLDETQERVLHCLDRKSGKLLWTKSVLKAPLEKKHKLNSFASGTPVTDGKLIYLTFLEPDFGDLRKRTPGELVVAAYDFEGEQKWLVKPGRFASVHGFCTSPILYKDKLIINGDHDGDSYLAALDATTGKTVWKVDRANKTRSYVTPIIREIEGRTQMIMAGSKAVTSYNPEDGSIHWTMDGPTEQFVASLVYNGSHLFLTAGFPEHHILAIDPTGSGNVTDSHVVWRTTKGCSYVPSPIVQGDYFLVVSDVGIGSCFDGANGKRLWMERLGSHYSASLVSSSGLVYFLSDDGIMKVIRPGTKLDVVAENPLDEHCYASPAISQGCLFIRGEKHLYCIGKP